MQWIVRMKLSNDCFCRLAIQRMITPHVAKKPRLNFKTESPKKTNFMPQEFENENTYILNENAKRRAEMFQLVALACAFACVFTAGLFIGIAIANLWNENNHFERMETRGMRQARRHHAQT